MIKALKDTFKVGWYDISNVKRGKAENATRYTYYGSQKPPVISGHTARYWHNNKWHTTKPLDA